MFKKKYRKLNSHNFTQIMNYCDLSKVVVGKKTYGEIHVTDFSPADTKLYIGSYCSIAPNVRFLLGGEHQLYRISTYPFKVLTFGESREAGSKGDIVVKDDGEVLCYHIYDRNNFSHFFSLVLQTLFYHYQSNILVIS